MKATISKIDHYNRKSDGSEISKITFHPTVDEHTGEIIFVNPRWCDGHFDKKMEGKTAKIE